MRTEKDLLKICCLTVNRGCLNTTVLGYPLQDRRCPGARIRLWRISSMEATGRKGPVGVTKALQRVSTGISCINPTTGDAERPYYHKELVSIRVEMNPAPFPWYRAQGQSGGPPSLTRVWLLSFPLLCSSGGLFQGKKNNDWLKVLLFLAHKHLSSMSESYPLFWGFRSKKEGRENTLKVNNLWRDWFFLTSSLCWSCWHTIL